MLRCNKCYLLFLFILFIGCSPSCKYGKIADKISYSLISDISKKYPMYYYSASGEHMTNVKTMSINVGIEKLCKIEEARKLIIDYSKDYLSRINNNEKIRPYLNQYPFTSKDVDLIFGLLDKNESNPSPEFVSMISLIKGYIYYFKSNPPSLRLILIKKEPYEEALKIIKQGKTNETTSF